MINSIEENLGPSEGGNGESHKENFPVDNEMLPFEMNRKCIVSH
jgi:hypothetical protein